MLTKISENLKNDEKLYYICYDSRSELLDQVKQDAEKKGVTNVTPFHNEEGQNLSEIIKEILEKNESSKKINFIVDEYDGEDLDEPEAQSLNQVFEGPLQQTFIVLIVQPIGKKRIVNNVEQNKNRFELLRNIEVYQLNRVMRNSVEIHNVVKLTTDVLQEQQTVYIHEVENTMKSNQKIHGSFSKILNVFRRKKPVMTVPDLGSDNIGEVTTKQVDPHEYREDSSNIPKLGSDETEVNPGPVKEAPYGDPNEYPEEKSSIPKLGLDEAQAVSGSVKRTSSRGAKTITKFLFEAADETAHKISSKKPAFFELWKKSDFEKTLSLIAIFEEKGLFCKLSIVAYNQVI